MKKTHRIQLVLITAALAACDRPLYPRGPDYAQAAEKNQTSAYYPPIGDPPDSTNSCPLAQSQLPPDFYLWYSGLQPFDFYYGSGIGRNGYYVYKSRTTIARGGFGRIGHGRCGHSAHS